MRILGLATGLLALPLLIPGPALAQKRIPKLPGYDQCPLGYVNDLKQHCNSPIYYEVKPTYGKPCDSGGNFLIRLTRRDPFALSLTWAPENDSARPFLADSSYLA